MTSTEWHVSEDVWVVYAAGRLDPAAEASVDVHITGCAVCRDAARDHVDHQDLTPVWETISAEIARPVRPRSTRVLGRLGLGDTDQVLLAASDALYLPWAVAVGTALVCAMLTGLSPVHQDAMFLLLAPLIPVLAVVAAYDATDPMRELAVATPYSKLRLALLRTTAALAVAVPVTLAVGLTVPGLEPLAFTWLLPALALTVSALVLLTWVGPWTAGGTVAVGWGVPVVAMSRAHELATLTTAAAQVAFVAVALAMAVLLVLRTTTFRLLGGES